jgi:sugar/nucleoside kinase (ribokinase family)
VIVVVGLPAYTDAPDGERCAGGLAVDVAVAAVGRGAAVELVGKVGEDGAGDAVVVALGRMGVGHAALLRDPVRSTPVLTSSAAGGADATATTEPEADAPEIDADAAPAARLLPDDATQRPGLEAADVELGLRYLPQACVIVVADRLPDAALDAAIDAAAFATARLVLLIAEGSPVPTVSPETTVLEAPADDDGSFGRLVGTFAAALDSGAEPAAAFNDALRSVGWESTGA